MATSVGDAQKQLESRPNDVEAQDVEAQDVEAQDVEAQYVEAQDVEAQDVEAPKLEAQELEAQELEAQELEAQDVEPHDVEAQDAEAQDVEAQGEEAKEMRRAILERKSTEEVNGETVWNTEIGCEFSGSAPAPGRRRVPVTVSCVTAHIVELYIGCVLSGPASASCRSGSVTVSCATAHSCKLHEIELAEVVGISDILPWPPPQQQMTRSKPQIV